MLKNYCPVYCSYNTVLSISSDIESDHFSFSCWFKCILLTFSHVDSMRANAHKDFWKAVFHVSLRPNLEEAKIFVVVHAGKYNYKLAFETLSLFQGYEQINKTGLGLQFIQIWFSDCQPVFSLLAQNLNRLRNYHISLLCTRRHFRLKYSSCIIFR